MKALQTKTKLSAARKPGTLNYNFLYPLNFREQAVDSVASRRLGFAVALVAMLLLFSAKAGAWTQLATSITSGLKAVNFTADELTGFVAGAGGTIAYTVNGGANWTVQTSGTTNTIYSLAFPTDAVTGYAAGANGTILKTTNGGTTWTAQTSGTTRDLFGITFPTGSTTGYAVGASGTILKTTNGGATWTAQTSGTTADLNAIVFKNGTNATGFIVGDGGIILKTTNSGATWSPLTSGTASNLYSIDYANSFNIYLACGAAGVMLKSTNGTSWTAQTSGTAVNLWGMNIPSVNKQAYAVGDGGTIVFTSNGGGVWNTDVSNTANILNAITFAPNGLTGYAVGAGGTILKGIMPSSDTTAPVITDNQAGDATWRTSNNGTYNVDFSDGGGSRLDYFMVEACSTNAACNDILDWTSMVININSNTYTTNWALPAGVWTALHEGINYISVQVSDGAGNVTISAGPLFYVQKDTLAPTFGIVTPASTDSGTQVDGTFNLSANFTDTGSGVSSCQVCKSIDGVCDTEWAAATWNAGSGGAGTCSTNALTCTNGQTLTLNMRATDAVAKTGTAVAATRKCDTVAPTTTDNWTDNWTNSTPVNVTLTPTDNVGGSGVGSTSYCVDSGNTCTPGTSGTSVAVTCAAGTLCTQYVRYFSTDAVGNAESVKSERVRQDVQPPSGGSVSFTNGYFTVLSVAVTFTNGGDGAGSGIASRAIQRSSATMTNGTCGAFGAWGNLITNPASSPYTDATVTDGNCYQYRYVETDNVGNQGIYTSASTAKIDSQAPAAVASCASFTPRDVSGGTVLSWDTPYSYNNPSPYVQWTAPSDNPATNNSGISGYYVYYGTNSSADPAVSGTFGAAANFTNSAVTMSAVNNYYFIMKSKDNAGNVSATSPACRYIFSQGDYLGITQFNDDATTYGGTLGSTDSPKGVLAPDNTSYKILVVSLYDQNHNVITSGNNSTLQVTLTMSSVGGTGAYFGSTNLTAPAGLNTTALTGNLVNGQGWVKMKANGAEQAAAVNVAIGPAGAALPGNGGRNQSVPILVRTSYPPNWPGSNVNIIASPDAGQLVMFPVWSHNGDQIAYNSLTGGVWNVYKIKYSGGAWGSPIRMTNTGMNLRTNSEITWSGNDSFIIFSVPDDLQPETELYAVSSSDNGTVGAEADKTLAQLRTANRMVTDNAYDPAHRQIWSDVDWSNTSCTNGYANTMAASMGHVDNGRIKGADIFLINGTLSGGLYHESSGGVVTQLTDFPESPQIQIALQPRWSNDCSKIAFVLLDGVSSAAKSAIYIMNLSDSLLGPTVSSFPVTSTGAAGLYALHPCSQADCTLGPAIFPSFTSDDSMISYSVEAQHNIDFRGLQQSDIKGAFFTGKNFDNYVQYIYSLPTLTPQLVGQTQDNEFSLTQCGGPNCPDQTNGKPMVFIVQSGAITGTLRYMRLLSESTVTSQGGLMFMNGGVVAVIPPGAVASETKLQVTAPATPGAGTCGGYNTDCKDLLVSTGDAREFFPDGVLFSKDILMVFHFCDTGNTGYLDVNQDSTCSGGGKTTIETNKLFVYYWCDANTHAGCTPNTWIKLNGSIDPVRHTITVATNHFSLYDAKALMRGTAAPGILRDLRLSNPHSYPNPWRSGDGYFYFNIDSDSSFNTLADGSSGNLTTAVQIYDIRGTLVRSFMNTLAGLTTLNAALDGSQSHSGQGLDLVSWDGRNNAGRPVVSGVYLYHMSVSDGVYEKEVTGKLSVLR